MTQPTTVQAEPTDMNASVARRSLILLLVLNLLTYMDRQVLAGVESLIQRDLLPNDPHAQTKMGLLATMFLVSYMVFSPVFGILGDKMSRWTLVGVGTILGSLATGWTGLAMSFAGIVAARCMVGISEAAYAPVAPTLLADLYPVEKRGRILAWFYAAIPVGSALGYAFGGLMAALIDWRWAFFGLVLPGLIAGGVALMYKDPRRGKAAQAAAGGPKNLTVRRAGLYKELFAIPSYVYCSIGMTAMTFAMGGIAFWMPRYITSQWEGAELTKVNLIFGGIVVVTGLAATLVGGWAGDRLRSRFSGSYFLVSAAGLLTGFPLFLLMLATPFPAAWVFVGLAVFCLFFNTGPTNTVLANVTRAPVRATAFALNIFIIHAFGDAISPPLIGFIADRSSLRVAMAAVSVTFLIGGVAWLMGARHLAEDTRRANEVREDNPTVA